MNAYIIVEGNETEMSVYPAWLSILAPHMQRIYDATQIADNNYYLFSANGIPSIFKHTANAIVDINAINSNPSIKGRYDFLIVCLDTEEESRMYIETKIQEEIDKIGVKLVDTDLFIFEQKVCMETWFLGNQKIFKNNPAGKDMIEFMRYYNVKTSDPEEMGTIDEDRYNKAQFHFRYLKRMLEERNITYNKSHTDTVRTEDYLNELIKRYENTHHIATFGSWYEFVRDHLK